MVKSVDPEGYVAKQYFNNRNFLIATERVVNSNKSNITKYEYDLEGNTTKVLKGLNSQQDKDYSEYIYDYNQLNQLVTMTDASKRKTSYEYDDNGNLSKLIDRNKVETSYTYDGLNRMVQKKNSKDGKKNAVTISFDKLGQTRQMSDASGTTIFDYDELGRMTGINYGNGIRQNYSYDKADRVSNLLVLQGSIKQINLNYEYDKNSRLTAVRDNGKKFGYKYNAIGQLTEENNGVTGVKSEYQYYPSGSIKTLRHWSGTKLLSGYEYKYDMRGNQTEKNEGTGTTKYYYDSLSRIKTVLEPGQTQNYEYDDLDNIKEKAVLKGFAVEETKYTYDRDNRLLLQETNDGIDNTQKRFTYDDNGNQLTKDEVVKRNGSTVASKDWNYWYDGFNQLSRVQNPDSQFTDYTYNGTGLRTKKDSGDKSTNYYYNGANIIMETDKDNAVTAKNIRGLRLIYRESYANGSDPQYLYYLHNAHGDVTQLLNQKAEVIKDYRYDAFGQEEAPESSKRLKFLPAIASQNFN
jgi:YD repeat-containing protein